MAGRKGYMSHSPFQTETTRRMYAVEHWEELSRRVKKDEKLGTIEITKTNSKITQTTREQRAKYANKAETSTLGRGEPSLYARELAQKYVDGHMEVKDVQKAIIDRYDFN